VALGICNKYPYGDYLEAAQTTGLSPNTLKNARYMDVLVKHRNTAREPGRIGPCRARAKRRRSAFSAGY